MENQEDSHEHLVREVIRPARATTRPHASLPLLIAAIGFSVGFVFAGGAIAYHFLVNIPEQERASNALKEQQFLAQKGREEETLRRTEIANHNYRNCLSDAEIKYSDRWNKHCATLSAEREQQYERCVQMNYGESQYCSYVQRVPRSDCQLPTPVAASYDAGYEQEKQLCLNARNIAN